jgi:hypothetical protein
MAPIRANFLVGASAQKHTIEDLNADNFNAKPSVGPCADDARLQMLRRSDRVSHTDIFFGPHLPMRGL